ncbi:YecA family protein [Orbus sturtevantii]|uniref:YecA/YgfB family protein n=1 Tax=Orbus sturtevantii TaxID=3074109 RepID=UPI00370DB3DF
MSLYTSLNSELKSQSIGITAAELHGFLSGILAGGNQDDSWRTLLEDMMNDGKPVARSLYQLIIQLYEQTKQQLDDDNFEFQLFISDQTLFEQIDDMVGWINHFLLGLGLAQPQLAKVKGNVGEAIYDLRQITQLGYDEDDDQEELAFAFEEILEYVRMTVILCHDEFIEPVQSTTIH